MEQVKPFHVPQERQNAFVFYMNGKDHIPSITVKWGKDKVTFFDGILRPCGRRIPLEPKRGHTPVSALPGHSSKRKILKGFQDEYSKALREEGGEYRASGIKEE
jgi:hypothetical protein